jgi:hypothetical protein
MQLLLSKYRLNSGDGAKESFSFDTLMV